MKKEDVAVYNPHGMQLELLPVIYGFNNGLSGRLLEAVVMAQDGTKFITYPMRYEANMPVTLGILNGSSPELHEKFKRHYPEGYQMEFVPSEDIDSNKALQRAMALCDEREGNNNQAISLMVNRFLMWKLPKHFSPDNGIAFEPTENQDYDKPGCWPIGTNLLTADQAREMIEYVLKVPPAPTFERK